MSSEELKIVLLNMPQYKQNVELKINPYPANVENMVSS
jgi:hypothetical protein